MEIAMFRGERQDHHGEMCDTLAQLASGPEIGQAAEVTALWSNNSMPGPLQVSPRSFEGELLVA